MTIVYRVMTLALAATIVSGCSGGSGSGSPAVTAPAAPAPQGKAVGKGTLSIVFPASFHRAAKATSIVRRSAAAARTPAYVNPTATNLLDIYVDGTLQLNLDGATPNDSATIVATADGTQTLSVPLYSTATNDIAVVEFDAAKANVLALGESPTTPQFLPGTAPTITVAMLMNVQGIAIADSNTGVGATMLQPYGAINDGDFCDGPATTNPFFLFATDADNGFAIVPGTGTTTTGYLGTVQPVVASSYPSVTTPPQTAVEPYNGGYIVSFDPQGNPITIYASVPSNPAASLFYNASVYPSFSNVAALANLVGLVIGTYSGNSALQGQSGASLSIGC